MCCHGPNFTKEEIEYVRKFKDAIMDMDVKSKKLKELSNEVESYFKSMTFCAISKQILKKVENGKVISDIEMLELIEGVSNELQEAFIIGILSCQEDNAKIFEKFQMVPEDKNQWLKEIDKDAEKFVKDAMDHRDKNREKKYPHLRCPFCYKYHKIGYDNKNMTKQNQDLMKHISTKHKGKWNFLKSQEKKLV